MLTKAQQDRIARRCTTAAVKPIDSFHGLLVESDPDEAAAVVAQIMVCLLQRSQAPVEPEPTLTLADIVAHLAVRDAQRAQ